MTRAAGLPNFHQHRILVAIHAQFDHLLRVPGDAPRQLPEELDGRPEDVGEADEHGHRAAHEGLEPLGGHLAREHAAEQGDPQEGDDPRRDDRRREADRPLPVAEQVLRGVRSVPERTLLECPLPVRDPIDLLEELEALLFTADLGVQTAESLLGSVRTDATAKDAPPPRTSGIAPSAMTDPIVAANQPAIPTPTLHNSVCIPGARPAEARRAARNVRPKSWPIAKSAGTTSRTRTNPNPSP